MHITPQVSTLFGDGGMVHSNHGTQWTSLHRSLLCLVMEGWCTQIMGHNGHHSTGLHCVWWRDGSLKSWDTMHLTPQVSTVFGDGGMVHSNHGTQCTSLPRSLLCMVMEGWCTQIMGHNAPHSTGLYCVVMEGWLTQIMGHNAPHSTGLYCVW